MARGLSTVLRRRPRRTPTSDRNHRSDFAASMMASPQRMLVTSPYGWSIHMATSSNRQKEIFLKALDLTSADARTAYLAQACDGDEAMRRQIDAMLQAHG